MDEIHCIQQTIGIDFSDGQEKIPKGHTKEVTVGLVGDFTCGVGDKLIELEQVRYSPCRVFSTNHGNGFD